MVKKKQIKKNSLVLFKKRPAVVVRVKDRLHIKLADGNVAKVRLKDVKLLHLGPVEDVTALMPDEGDLVTGWEVLLASVEENETIDLDTLAEFVFGSSSPANNWAAWLLVEDGLYFSGDPACIEVRTADQVEVESASRRSREEQKQRWQNFIDRAQNGQIDFQLDAEHLRDLEEFALGRTNESQLLKSLGRNERPEIAHALLLKWNYWDETVNPYPVRLGLNIKQPSPAAGFLAVEKREDLTYMKSYAIDDRGNRDPDDAISLESAAFDQGRLEHAVLWVHIADVAAQVTLGSPVEEQARRRSASLYLPENTVNMLPGTLVSKLGLGLENPSPALSFRIELKKNAEVERIEIMPSRVNVERVSYEDAEILMEAAPLKTLSKVLDEFTERRRNRGALFIDFPEIHIRVKDGEVNIRPLEKSNSRNLVREAMLLAGEAAGKFASQEGIPFPYVIQEPPIVPEHPEQRQLISMPGLAGQFALRKMLRSSHTSGEQGFHSGIGVACYSRVTSPLRRYVDLIAHMQLRGYLHKEPPLDQAQLLERVAAAEAVSTSIRRAEHYSRRHWTLVYLLQCPGWQGKGILLDRNGVMGRVIIPDLALETSLHLAVEKPLNSELNLALKSVNLPELEAGFYIHPLD
jgi:exoribonuclease-2